MESCISLHQRCSSQKGGRLDLSFHPQILPKKNSESLKPDCIMYAPDSKFDICGRNTNLAVHNKHLDQYLRSGHETEVHSVPTWPWTLWLNVVVQIVFVDNKKLQETLLHDIDADQLCSEYGGSGDLILLQDVVQFPHWWPLSCIKSKE
jgi:hypothetical protein